MKKVVALILALSMVFALCACGNQESIEAENAVQSESEPKVTDLDLLINVIESMAESCKSKCDITQTETDEDIHFTAEYVDNERIKGIVCKYSGSATKEGKITHLEYTFAFPEEEWRQGVYKEMYQNLSVEDVKKILALDVGSFNSYELYHYTSLFHFCEVLLCLSDNNNEWAGQLTDNAKANEYLAETSEMLLKSREEQQTINGWTITMEMDNDIRITRIIAERME